MKRRRASCVWDGECDGRGCKYHRWDREDGFCDLGAGSTFSLKETYRRLLSRPAGGGGSSGGGGGGGGLVRRGQFVRSGGNGGAVLSSAAGGVIKRVAAFLRLLDHLGTAPWASSRFSTNGRMITRLVACHLPVIVGKDDARVHRETLISFVDPGGHITDAQNTVWITNRQQGKTSTLGKFIAALAIFSPCGGCLATVYSTGLDRAVELVKAAKQYVNWMRGDSGRMREHASILLTRDNERSFTIRTAEGVHNEVAARPRNVDSCRGDAPLCAFFDEAAFMSEAFWYQFAYPLLQVKGRVFTCTTTPPPADNYFAAFARSVKAEMERGNTFFVLINHALACEECISAGVHEECTHQLYLIPPWKSLLRMTHMSSLVPAGRKKDFQAEVYGVCHASDGFYFKRELIDAMRDRARLSRPDLQGNVIYIAVDPGSHQSSEMGLVACGLSAASGQTVVLGVAVVTIGRFETYHIQAVARLFTQRVLKSTSHIAGTRLVVPIIECNNNEVVAMSIKTAIDSVAAGIRGAEPHCPFTARHFAKNITAGLGVWTTDANKLAAVQEMQSLLLEGRILFASPVSTVSRSCVDTSTAVSRVDVVETLCDQLARVKDDEHGRISGKSSHGDADDIAIALLIGIYWSAALRAAVSSSRGGGAGI